MNVIHVDPGQQVLCDWCDREYTDSPVSGGFMFSRHATGPCCAARIEASAASHGEMHLIGSCCPDTLSFADWIRDIIRDPTTPLPGTVAMSLDEARDVLTRWTAR